MSQKVPISNIILSILASKKAYSEEDFLYEVLNQLKIRSFEASSTQNASISRSLKNLLNTGQIEHFKTTQGLFIMITNSGKQKLLSSILDSKMGIAAMPWDGYFRFVMLDIPESRKSERDAIRYLLQKAGFICLKNSVWVNPYPYENIFNDIKKHYNLKNEMVILATNLIDSDTQEFLLKKFKLK